MKLEHYMNTCNKLTVKEIRYFSCIACERSILNKNDLLDIRENLNNKGIGYIAGFHILKTKASEYCRIKN